MMITGASGRARTAPNTSVGPSVVMGAFGSAAVGYVCQRGVPALIAVGSASSGKTPMCPQASKLVISTDPRERPRLDPERLDLGREVARVLVVGAHGQLEPVGHRRRELVQGVVPRVVAPVGVDVEVRALHPGRVDDALEGDGDLHRRALGDLDVDADQLVLEAARDDDAAHPGRRAQGHVPVHREGDLHPAARDRGHAEDPVHARRGLTRRRQDLDPELAKVLSQMMQHDVDNRFQTPADVVEAIDALPASSADSGHPEASPESVAHSPGITPPVVDGNRQSDSRSGQWIVWWIGGAVILLIIAWLIYQGLTGS